MINRTIALRAKNLGASALFVVIGCSVCALLPHWRGLLEQRYGWEGFSFTGIQYLGSCALTYMVALAVYYLTEREPDVSKSVRCLQVAIEFARAPGAAMRSGLSLIDRLAVLATLLKIFFAPVMVIILLLSFMGAIQEGAPLFFGGVTSAGFVEAFNAHGFWLVMHLILLVDVAVFTAGYLVEMRRLNNEIRSVDPTVLGWTAALLCYYPFSVITGMVLGRQVSDFPQFDDPAMHITLNIVLLVLMTIYASASVALGFKGSNLTHRGIVVSGPYAIVRHPAYACKNLAWWIGGVPVVSAAFSISFFTGVTAVASIVGWSLLYVLRAVTEEDHLRSVDGDYAAYATRVRYRFVPGVL